MNVDLFLALAIVALFVFLAPRKQRPPSHKHLRRREIWEDDREPEERW